MAQKISIRPKTHEKIRVTLYLKRRFASKFLRFRIYLSVRKPASHNLGLENLDLDIFSIYRPHLLFLVSGRVCTIGLLDLFC
jgi:hypothetical protein